MKVTFLIGNGFDIGLGMRTKFEDMYKGYININSSVQHIKEFKYALKQDSPNYRTWGDFEMGMAKYAKKFSNEGEFIECVRDFKTYMVQYLQQEQKKMYDIMNKNDNYANLCAEDVKSSVLNFYKGQSNNVIIEMEEMLNLDSINTYNFITFNYTTVLDFMLVCCKRRMGLRINGPIHVHGRIDEDVVLGIDNEKQLQDIKFSISKKLQRAFIKPLFNNMFDKYRVESAMGMIEESDVICIYGMSLGESDRTWVNKIIEWLDSDEAHHLFYYDYTDESYNMWNRDQMLDMEDEKKERFMKKIIEPIEDITQIEEQIHIPIAYDIFNIKDMLMNVEDVSKE